MRIANFISCSLTVNSKSIYRLYLFSFILILSITSCHQKEKVVYFQGEQSSTLQNISYNPTLKPDDILSIQVFGQDEATVKLFNISSSNFNQNIGGYSTGNPAQFGYLINSDGFIDFPVLGKLKLQGLNRQQAVDLLK